MLKLYMKSIQIQGIHQNTPTSHHMVTIAVVMAAAIIVAAVAVTSVSEQIVEAMIERKTKRRKNRIEIHTLYICISRGKNKL